VCDEVYLPLLRQWRKVRRQFTWRIEPLFSGYLFARFSVEQSFRAVRYTPGVIRVLSTVTDELIEVDQTIIAALRQRSVDGYVQVSPAPLLSGEVLEITEGPFKGLRALFQEQLRAGERVAVLMDLLSAQVRVELPRAYVQKTVTVLNEPRAA
jgi:transcriptional antiterminator RfaH